MLLGGHAFCPWFASLQASVRELQPASAFGLPPLGGLLSHGRRLFVHFGVDLGIIPLREAVLGPGVALTSCILAPLSLAGFLAASATR